MARRRGYSGIPDIYDRWGLISPNLNSPQSKFDGAVAVTLRDVRMRGAYVQTVLADVQWT